MGLGVVLLHDSSVCWWGSDLRVRCRVFVVVLGILGYQPVFNRSVAEFGNSFHRSGTKCCIGICRGRARPTTQNSKFWYELGYRWWFGYCVGWERDDCYKWWRGLRCGQVEGSKSSMYLGIGSRVLRWVWVVQWNPHTVLCWVVVNLFLRTSWVRSTFFARLFLD